jgi:thiol-disulfide isomerase/thioredoxin
MAKKRLFFLIIFCLAAFAQCMSQGVSVQPKKIPPFRVLLANNQIFKAEHLPPGKPVVIFYFSIECDHCKSLITEMCKKMDEFKKATIVMITFYSTADIRNFSQQFNLNKFPNIIVGTEGTGMLVRSYYHITNTPFVAFHDQLGNYIASYSNNVNLNELIKRINNLK